MLHYNVLITGKVQGVYYRASAKDKAIALGLSGFVRNEPDGSVYLEAEGNEEKVKALVEWCKLGPPSAIVERVDVTAGAVAGFNGFEIRRR
jgi:acylphosphatase